MVESGRPYGVVMVERMNALNFGVNELARASGVSRETIRRYRRDPENAKPDAATRRKLDAVLARPPAEMVGNVVASNAAEAVALAEQIEQMRLSLEARLEDVLDELAELRHELTARAEWLRVAEQVFDVAP